MEKDAKRVSWGQIDGSGAWRANHLSSQAKAAIAYSRRSGYAHPMKYVPKENTDDALIQEYLDKGGKVSVGKTKPPNPELGLSKNVWNNKLTNEEKAARDKKPG